MLGVCFSEKALEEMSEMKAGVEPGTCLHEPLPHSRAPESALTPPPTVKSTHMLALWGLGAHCWAGTWTGITLWAHSAHPSKLKQAKAEAQVARSSTALPRAPQKACAPSLPNSQPPALQGPGQGPCHIDC